MSRGLRDIEEATARAVEKVEAYGEELRAEEREQLEENKRLNDEARAHRLAREAEAKAEQERARERIEEIRRKELEDRLKGAMRVNFLAANPAATAGDFERLWPRLRDEHYSREAETSRARHERAMLADGMYSSVL